ncbi:MAG: hypothetical protein PHS37_05660 [Candidatus Omnitrophica bacterium]|nr:hypothetical protein [Candidatus Omnitrophota bacterium]
MELEKLINKSTLHKAIVSFFHENQSSVDTPRGIATWVRGDYQRVRSVCEELTRAGILESHKTTSTIAYSYTRNPKTIARVGNILEQ